MLKNALSPYDNYCDGFGPNHSSGNDYVLAVVLGVGKAKMQFNHEGSKLLDEINAFDLAEVDGPYIGQINMSIVSSFCGPQGMIWGYDLAKATNLYSRPERGTFPSFVEEPDTNKKIPVYSILPLVNSAEALLGNVTEKKFILRPGAHVPCAGKNIKKEGPGIIYSAIAIGIAEDRDKEACLIMEDIGEIPIHEGKTQNLLNRYQDLIYTNLVKSVLQIGRNQRVKYKEIFVGLKSIHMDEGEIACSLVACPYLTLAKNAIFKDTAGKLDFQRTIDCNIEEWIENRK